MLWSEFLETIPANVEQNIEDLFVESPHWLELRKSEIRIHCWSDICNGIRIFDSSVTPHTNAKEMNNVLIEGTIIYTCRHCQKIFKYYSIRCWKDNGNILSGRATKYGEIPPFGPPVPPRIISLIGPDRELFLKGRRSENQGLGVGAFAYYRQIIERQKDRLFNEIKKVAKRLGASPSELQLFDQAISETQFNKGVDLVRAAIPQSLLIDGHNPLTLLHSALSRDIHVGTDEECLEAAQDIRVILTELAERITVALKDEAELKQSVTRLLSRGQNKLEDRRNKDV